MTIPITMACTDSNGIYMYAQNESLVYSCGLLLRFPYDIYHLACC